MSEVVLILTSTNNIITGDRIIKLADNLRPEGIEVAMTERRIIARTSGPEVALRVGITRFLLEGQLQLEGTLPKQTGSQTDALDILRWYVEGLKPTAQLTVVDPYFLAGSDSIDFLSRFDTVFASSLAAVSSFRVIHNGRDALLGSLSAHLQNTQPHLALYTHTVSDFHDRVWIADSARGLYVGTSLNGVGRKFALVDYIDSIDTKDVISQLRTSGVTGA